MNIELHPDARQELLGAAAHYAAIQPALADRFLEVIDAALVDIAAYPESSAEIEQDVRRKLTRVFPYALLYTLEQDYVLVLAVMHCHQRPGYWRTRLTTD